MFLFALLSLTFLIFLLPIIKRKLHRMIILRKSQLRQESESISIGFLHPQALSGGGGERVLWCAIQAVQEQISGANIVIYSAWNTSNGQGSKVETVKKTQSCVAAQFGLNMDYITFVPVDISQNVSLIDPLCYPRLTLIRQAIGAVKLGAIAYWKHPVDVFVDTANLSFSLIVPKLLCAKTLSYVHYPIISTDMLAVVRSRKSQFNNTSRIASSSILTAGKLIYYWMFALIYALSSLFIDVVAVNSSWTRTHLETIWKRKRISTVYPPCSIQTITTARKRDKTLIVSVGQFRPEKNHQLQLDIMSHLSEQYPELQMRLAIVGGTRNDEDEARAKRLSEEVARRNLPVDFYINASRQKLQEILQQACVGLHTMRDEHFGISVVELQAAGVIVVGHDSGGVAADIVQNGVTGYLADGCAAIFGETIANIAKMGDTERERISDAALGTCERYSEIAFRTRFRGLLELCTRKN